MADHGTYISTLASWRFFVNRCMLQTLKNYGVVPWMNGRDSWSVSRVYHSTCRMANLSVMRIEDVWRYGNGERLDLQ